MAIKLNHCKEARFVRPLWTLDEMDIPYEPESMPFSRRMLRIGYLDVNPLGTVSCMTQWVQTMTKSAGIPTRHQSLKAEKRVCKF